MRIEIGIEHRIEDESADAPMPVRITIDGVEPPPGSECATDRCIELRVDAAGKTLEEAEAREHLTAMGFDVTDIEIEDCGDYYRVRVGGGMDGCCPGGDAGTVLGKPPSESKTWGEVKKEFTG